MSIIKPKLYLMLGYPGAGKTTVATLIQSITGATHLNSDQIRLELFPQPAFTQAEHDQLYQEVDRRTKDLLTAGKDVIYDANLNRFRHRQEKYELCKHVAAQPVLIWVKAGKEVARERRVKDISSHHLVPQNEDPGSMFERLVGVFEEPGASEPFITVDGEQVSESIIRNLLS